MLSSRTFRHAAAARTPRRLALALAPLQRRLAKSRPHRPCAALFVAPLRALSAARGGEAPSAAGSEPPVLASTGGSGVRTLALNRPRARNALSTDVLLALQRELRAAAEDPGVRVVVLRGSGPAFCSGHDLKEMVALRELELSGGGGGGGAAAGGLRAVFDLCSDVMRLVAELPKPVIAQVHGIATAAGCQLVASADLAVASSSARFATPGVDIGLFCSTPSVALSRCVGRKQSMWMLLTGDMVGAEEARDLGLVNRVVPDEDLDAEVASLAERVAAKSAESIRFGKGLFGRQLALPLEDAYREASTVMVDNMLAEDAGEGISAFLQKRAPEWPSHRTVEANK